MSFFQIASIVVVVVVFIIVGFTLSTRRLDRIFNARSRMIHKISSVCKLQIFTGGLKIEEIDKAYALLPGYEEMLKSRKPMSYWEEKLDEDLRNYMASVVANKEERKPTRFN